MDKKKSFVIYFDSWRAIEALDYEQCGLLFRALIDYAIRASEQPLDVEESLAQQPELSGEARMAYRFIAGSIARDTAKWLSAQERRSKAMKEREQGKKKDDRQSWMDAYV